MTALILADLRAAHAELRRELHEEFASVVEIAAQQCSVMKDKLSAQIRSDLRLGLREFFDKSTNITRPTMPGMPSVARNSYNADIEIRNAKIEDAHLLAENVHLESGLKSPESDEWSINLWSLDETDVLWAVSETDALLGCSKGKPVDNEHLYRQVSEAHDDEEHVNTLAGFMQSVYMDYFTVAVIICNAICIGCETEHAAAHIGDPMPRTYELLEFTFCAMFNLELVLRLYAFGAVNFTMIGWQWNLFDFSLVLMQNIELVVKLFSAVGPFGALLRSLRLIRILRMARLLRLVDELRTIVTSIMGSMQPFLWTLVLLVMIIYTTAVLVTPIASEWRSREVPSEALEDVERFYGTFLATSLTMYESISGGLSWNDAMQPLMTIHPVLGIFFCLYIALAVFAILNVVTGIFCDRANEFATRERTELVGRNLWNIIRKSCGPVIDLEEFRRVLNQENDLRAYFQDIGAVLHDTSVDSTVTLIFRLLDEDGGGEIDKDEFLNGCLRLRGHARALDLLMHANATHQSFSWLDEMITRLDGKITWVCETLLKQLSSRAS